MLEVLDRPWRDRVGFDLSAERNAELEIEIDAETNDAYGMALAFSTATT